MKKIEKLFFLIFVSLFFLGCNEPEYYVKGYLDNSDSVWSRFDYGIRYVTFNDKKEILRNGVIDIYFFVNFRVKLEGDEKYISFFMDKTVTKNAKNLDYYFLNTPVNIYTHDLFIDIDRLNGRKIVIHGVSPIVFSSDDSILYFTHKNYADFYIINFMGMDDNTILLSLITDKTISAIDVKNLDLKNITTIEEFIKNDNTHLGILSTTEPLDVALKSYRVKGYSFVLQSGKLREYSGISSDLFIFSANNDGIIHKE